MNGRWPLAARHRLVMAPRPRRWRKRAGKWVHMGRVNTDRRIRYAAAIGCDSIDGTKWVRWRDAYLNDGLRKVGADVQLALEV
jgi:hypothetical protein